MVNGYYVVDAWHIPTKLYPIPYSAHWSETEVGTLDPKKDYSVINMILVIRIDDKKRNLKHIPTKLNPIP